MAHEDLKKLEREADEKTLAFWEAIEAKDAAENHYRIAEIEMSRAKADYLREKLKVEEGHYGT